MESIKAMANMASTFKDWEVVRLASVSSALLLRISEATMHLIDQAGVPKAQFEGAKSRRGTNQM